MNNSNYPEILKELSKKADKPKILESLILQLEKDTGLDYTGIAIPEKLEFFVEKLRTDLKFYLQKTASQNHTKFMNIIFRVDISQSKMNKIEMNEHYFENLAEAVLNRLFQKILTTMFLK